MPHSASSWWLGRRGSEASGSEDGDSRAVAAQAEALLQAGGALPPQALDVTAACRFLVEAGKLRFHAGALSPRPCNK